MAKFALKAQAQRVSTEADLGDPETCDDAPFDLLAGLPGCLGDHRYALLDSVEGEKQIGRARRVPIEVGPVAFPRISLVSWIWSISTVRFIIVIFFELQEITGKYIPRTLAESVDF